MSSSSLAGRFVAPASLRGPTLRGAGRIVQGSERKRVRTPWTLGNCLIYRPDGRLPGRQTLNDLLTMPDLNSRGVRSASHCPACAAAPTLVPARHGSHRHDNRSVWSMQVADKTIVVTGGASG